MDEQREESGTAHGSVRCIHDMLNDEGYTDYTSEVNTTESASIHRCHAPPFISLLDIPLPDPEPPLPSISIKVEDVSPLECAYNALFPVGERFHAHEECPVYCGSNGPPITPETSHLLWDTHMLPVSELEDCSVTPQTILKFLALDDASRFTTPISRMFLTKHHVRLQIDGGGATAQ